MKNLEEDLKRLIIDIFELEDISPADIASDTALFGEGLGLDSIDALELGLALKKRYNIYIDTHSTGLAEHFASVKNLARYVVSQQEAKNV